MLSSLREQTIKTCIRNLDVISQPQNHSRTEDVDQHRRGDAKTTRWARIIRGRRKKSNWRLMLRHEKHRSTLCTGGTGTEFYGTQPHLIVTMSKQLAIRDKNAALSAGKKKAKAIRKAQLARVTAAASSSLFTQSISGGGASTAWATMLSNYVRGMLEGTLPVAPQQWMRKYATLLNRNDFGVTVGASGSFSLVFRPHMAGNLIKQTAATVTTTNLNMKSNLEDSDVGVNVFRAESNSRPAGYLPEAPSHAKLPHSDGMGGKVNTVTNLTVMGNMIVNNGGGQFVPDYTDSDGWHLVYTSNVDGSTNKETIRVGANWNRPLAGNEVFTLALQTRVSGVWGTVATATGTIGGLAITATSSVLNMSTGDAMRLLCNCTAYSELYIRAFEFSGIANAGSPTFSFNTAAASRSDSASTNEVFSAWQTSAISSMGVLVTFDGSSLNNQGRLASTWVAGSAVPAVISYDWVTSTQNFHRARADAGVASFWIPTNVDQITPTTPEQSMKQDKDVMVVVIDGVEPGTTYQCSDQLTVFGASNSQSFVSIVPEPYPADLVAQGNWILTLIPRFCDNPKHGSALRKIPAAIFKAAKRFGPEALKIGSAVAKPMIEAAIMAALTA